MPTHLFPDMAPVHGGTFLDVDDPSSPEAFGVTERSSVSLCFLGFLMDVKHWQWKIMEDKHWLLFFLMDVNDVTEDRMGALLPNIFADDSPWITTHPA